MTYDSRMNNSPLAEAKKRVLDSLGCYFGAFDTKAVSILRRTLADHQQGSCSLWGMNKKAAPELAAWLNGAGVRALDFNDTYLSKEPCHPSDLISTFWAACEISDRKNQGKLLLEAILIGYDTMVRLCDAASIRVKGWDHVTYLPIASANGCSHILGLSESQRGHAIALALVGNTALRQTRVGTISDWKAACAAYAARAGLSAARLAKNGFTGPSDIFRGHHGFFKQVSGKFDNSFLKKRPAQLKNSSSILKTHIKYFPAEHHAQSAVEAAVQIYNRIRFRPETVGRITIDCFEVAVSIIGSEKEKWQPTTRETADHSMPYLTVIALLEGTISTAQFEKKRYLDSDVRQLLAKVSVRDNKRYSRLYPKQMPSRVTVEFIDGTHISEEVMRPKGYAGRPMSFEEVEQKFSQQAKKHLSPKQMQALIKNIKNLDKIDKLSSIL
jgi:2-methylcitrate dehydratase